MTEKMRAAIYHSNSRITVEDVDIPDVSDDQLLVKTITCGLCGGEAMEWYHIKRAPKVMGHEPAGVVVRAGKDVKRFKEGDRVFVNHHVPRLNSHQSLRGHFTKDEGYKRSELVPGAMCQYFRVSAAHVENGTYLLPADVGFDVATILEPWACVLGGLKVSGIQPGDTVVVMGCGFMGQGFVHMARLFGAGQVIAADLSAWRRTKAMELGASHTIDPVADDARQKLRDLNHGRLADVVISTVPIAKVIEQAYGLVGVGGTLHVNAPPPPDQTWAFSPFDAYDKELTITNKYSADPRDVYQLLRLLESRRIEPARAITHRFDLSGVSEAFRLLLRGDESLKSVIYPNGLDALG